MNPSGSISVLLLGGLSGDESPSMKRYGMELHDALRASPHAPATITLEQPPPCRGFARLVDTPRARRFDRAWTRWVSYPGSLRGRRVGVFHILDQAYAHLIRSLDASRTVVTCHDLIPLLVARGELPPGLSTARAGWVMRRQIAFLERASRIIAVSAATKTTLERHTAIDPARIAVVHSGVNPVFRVLPEARAARLAAAGLAGRAHVLLQVAGGVRYKNTATLLRAVAQVRERVRDIVLVRVGAPLFADEAALADRLGLTDLLAHVGRVADAELAEWYNAADVLVFPSMWEGFGWPPLEAMACGTPVVASNVPAVEEIVGDAGLLVPPRDPEAIAAAIERVLTDPAAAAALRRKGRDRAARFTWAAAAARTIAVYEEVAGT